MRTGSARKSLGQRAHTVKDWPQLSAHSNVRRFFCLRHVQHTVASTFAMTLTNQPCLKWETLVDLPNSELGRVDIAAYNLACAEGLPGSDEIDYDYCLYKINDWAGWVKDYTNQLFPQFRRDPSRYENSEAYYRTLCMITVLQRDMGVRYNPAKIPQDAPFEPADSFIHGIIQGDGGTCVSIPVVYVAVGRRLGYPMKLVSTRGKVFNHSFARWEDPNTGERFNIEATNKGLSTPSDDYYRTDPFHVGYELTPEIEKEGCYLQSKTPRMELATFLSCRAWHWEDAMNWPQCIHAWACAASLVPNDQHTVNALKRAMKKWDTEQQDKKPPGFPSTVWVNAKSRLYPHSLPLELEKDICGLMAVHNILNDPVIEAKHWGRMRRGDFNRVPIEATATFEQNGRCQVNLRVL